VERAWQLPGTPVTNSGRGPLPDLRLRAEASGRRWPGM